METQEWWRAKWYKTPTVEFVEWVIAESIRRRDAELLERVEGMHQHVVKHNLFAPANVMERRYARGFNAALDQLSEIIKGE